MRREQQRSSRRTYQGLGPAGNDKALSARGQPRAKRAAQRKFAAGVGPAASEKRKANAQALRSRFDDRRFVAWRPRPNHGTDADPDAGANRADTADAERTS